MREAQPTEAPVVAPRPVAQNGALLALVSRLDDLLREETNALRERRYEAIESFAFRKEQALLELRRLIQTNPDVESSGAIAALRRLRAQVDINMTQLGNHVHALNELSQTVADSLAAEESDGTYRRLAQGEWGIR